MNILFFISIITHGRGGHVHSLMTTVHEVAKYHNCDIYAIGNGCDSTIKQSPYYCGAILVQGYNLSSIKRNVDHQIKWNTYDVIHFFDSASYLCLATHPKLESKRVVLTLCGGPNNFFYPYCQHQIVFSSENFQWFQSYNKNVLPPQKMLLFPARVTKSQARKVINNQVYNFQDPSQFTFVKIARIGRFYYKSIKQSINLIKELVKRDTFSVRLLIVGVVESADYYVKLRKLAKGYPIQFITESCYTKSAVDFFSIANIGIATGRGVMESLANDIPTMVANANRDFPALITTDTLKELFNKNFSERTYSSTLDETTLKRINQLVSCKSIYRDACIEAGDIFHNYFDLEGNIFKLIEFYDSVSLFKYSEPRLLLSKLKTLQILYGFNRGKFY